MKTQEIRDIVFSKLKIDPTVDQSEFVAQFAEFLNTKERFKLFVLKGYAGTGKTTMMSALVESLPYLRIQTVLLAPTGRAAKVLSNYTGKQALTIHKKIYLRKEKAGFAYFELAPNKHKDTLFIIDEASMIGQDGQPSASGFGYRNLLEDLLRFIYRGERCMALFVGDTAQLPPVGMEDSPALNEIFLSENFNLIVQKTELKQVVRQASESGILYNATAIREQLKLQQFTFPKIKTSFPDIRTVNGNELQDELEWAFNHCESGGVIVVTRSNKRANLFNQQIRSRIFWIENEINGGDRLMVVKNNYYWLPQESDSAFIANGDILVVQKVKKIEQLYDLYFATLDVKFADNPDEPELEVKVILNSILVEGASLPAEEMRKFYEKLSEEYSDEPDPRKRKEKIFSNPYFNALQVKFAWAVTCHKAQGGQWPVVFIDQGYLTDEMIDKEFLRWLYTAFTRATERLYLVNFSEKFFSGDQ